MDKSATNAAGARAEDAAADHLRRAGLRLLCRNWRCRYGEIDLVAEDEGMLVFVEVRMRSGAGLFGGARESITAAKRSRIRAAASLYLARNGEADCRFDVLLIDAHSGGRIEWIRDAFGE
jgi:putative endonuclease